MERDTGARSWAEMMLSSNNWKGVRRRDIVMAAAARRRRCVPLAVRPEDDEGGAGHQRESRSGGGRTTVVFVKVTFFSFSLPFFFSLFPFCFENKRYGGEEVINHNGVFDRAGQRA